MSDKNIASENAINTENEVKQAGIVIKLSRPVIWEEQEIKELRINVDGLSGDDALAIEGDFIDFIRGQKNVLVSYKKEHPSYLAVFAARASGVHPNFMKKLSIKDFMKVTGVVQDFLISMG